MVASPQAGESLVWWWFVVLYRCLAAVELGAGARVFGAHMLVALVAHPDKLVFRLAGTQCRIHRRSRGRPVS